MGIEYAYNVGYGFLLPEKQFALPTEWSDREQWYDGDVDKDISGSGLTAVFGGSMWSGDHVWGFIAAGSKVSMNPHSNELVKEIRDVEPQIFSNLQDLRTQVKRPNARIGWVMWADIY